MNDLMKGGAACLCCLLCVTVIALPLMSFRTVQPGEIAVVSVFNYVQDQPMLRGTHMTNPFAVLVPFSLKTTKLDFHQSVPTNEGLLVQLEVVMLYHILPEKVRNLYVDVGTNFENTVLRPELASAVRSITSTANAEALYDATQRSAFQQQLKVHMKSLCEPRGVGVESVLLKDVQLPDILKRAIESKSAAEQEALKMEFVLEKERQEAKRKAIEAEGIAQFQETVSTGISDKLLQWKGIEATEKFSTAPNSKIVIMGNGGGNMPVILNAGDTPGAPAAPAIGAR